MRLAAALAELDALYNLPDRRRIAPDLNRIRSLTDPQLLRTKYGRLDVLKEAGGLAYNDLINDAHQVNDYETRPRCSHLQARVRPATIKSTTYGPERANTPAVAADKWGSREHRGQVGAGG